MKTIELQGQVDEQDRLLVNIAEAIAPGPVKVLLQVPDDEHDWAQGVAMIWNRDWSDPREEIYSLGDGQPENEPG